MKKILGVVAFGALIAFARCSPTVTVKHEVEPIYITVDINIKVQKELEDFFDFEEEPKETKEKQE